MNGKTYNRFEWQKTQCNTLHELKEVFPKGHVTGKRIKALTQIGAADSWWLRKGIPFEDLLVYKSIDYTQEYDDFFSKKTVLPTQK